MITLTIIERMSFIFDELRRSRRGECVAGNDFGRGLWVGCGVAGWAWYCSGGRMIDDSSRIRILETYVCNCENTFS